MTYAEALEIQLAGGKIRRSSWEHGRCWEFKRGDYALSQTPFWPSDRTITKDHIEATDWEQVQ